MRNIIILLVIIILLSIGISFVKRIEHFDNPDVSPEEDVSGGASEYYGWGFPGIQDKHKKVIKQKCPKCDHVYIDNNVCNIVIDDRHKCKYCDITQNKDIDKYVLKSSIPPCPDMSRYATKNMVKSCPDINKYVLKSKIPEYCASYWPDHDKYMLKSQCKPIIDEKYEIIHNDITKHPDYHKYILKEDCKKYKKSWIQDFEEWWDSLFGKKKNTYKSSTYPHGYSYTPYAGYGTDNPGYALDGGRVKERYVHEAEETSR